jgi:low temperature requirement protein LtrA
VEAASAERGARRRLAPALRDGAARVKPLELFFDLVFVLGFTQCTALMVHHPTWEGMAQGVLVLTLLWWSWGGFAWLTSVLDPEEGGVRIAMFASMAALLVVALCVPEAFGDRALAFALSYGAVRVGHLVLFALASRDDPSLRHSVITLAISTMIGVALLVVASMLDGWAQGAMWVAAILIDYGGPAIFGVEGWRLVPSHFAERHGLVIILALGESIVALGVGASVGITAEVIAAAALGIGLASAIWWIYFDVVALITERRLSGADRGRNQNALARDSYSYLHLPMVIGIVLSAFGLEQTLAHVDEPLKTVPAFGLLGGVSIYLLAHVALRLRNAHTVSVTRLGLAIILLALMPLAVEVGSLVTLAIVNVLIWAMIAYETTGYGEVRYRLRHGVNVSPEHGQPSSS